ncbi:MAG: hypothetical protein LBT36_01525 [Oscillospiraceae bacterium]|nr:hypothetical protein [Oscillospiraceae bacterium]
MLALVEYAPAAAQLWRRFFPRKPVLTPDAVLGLRVLRACVDSERSAARYARELARAGADRVCFAADFPFRAAFGDFPEARTEGLMQAFLPELADALSVPGGAAYLCGSAGDAETFRRLYLKNRYVLTDMPRGGALTREARRAAGVSVLENPSPARILTATLAVFTREPARPVTLGRECVAVAPRAAYLERVAHTRRVYGIAVDFGGDLRVPEPPPCFPRAALLTEAYLRGGVSRREIRLRAIKILTKDGNNTIITRIVLTRDA